MGGLELRPSVSRRGGQVVVDVLVLGELAGKVTWGDITEHVQAPLEKALAPILAKAQESLSEVVTKRETTISAALRAAVDAAPEAHRAEVAKRLGVDAG